MNQGHQAQEWWVETSWSGLPRLRQLLSSQLKSTLALRSEQIRQT
jgi:hypothetical protein